MRFFLGLALSLAALNAGVTPFVEVTSRVQTQNRFVDISKPTEHAFTREAPDTLRYHTRATQLLPTDGIVRSTALKVTQGARSDAQKARAIYDWVVANAWREPKTRGFGDGDIKTAAPRCICKPMAGWRWTPPTWPK